MKPPPNDTSNAILQATMDTSMDMIQIFKAVRNEAGLIIDFTWILNNQTAENIYGNVIGKSLLETTPGVLIEGIFDTFKQVVETGIPSKTERHYVHEQFNGWFIQSVVKLEDGVVTTTLDITDRKKAEEEIKEQAHFIQSITYNSPDLVTITRHPAGEIEFSNRDDMEILGYEADEIFKMGHAGRLKLLHPDDVQGLKDYYARFDTLKHNEENRVEYRIKSKDGSWAWLDVRGRIFRRDAEGRVTHTLHVGHDITSRKRSEQEIIGLKDEVAKKVTDKYFALFNAIEEGFALCELIRDDAGKPVDYRILEWNPAFEKQAVHRIHETPPRMVVDVLPESEEPYQWEYHHKNLQRWYLISIYPLDKDRFCTLFNDITERKVLAERMRTMKEAYQSIVNGASIESSLRLLTLLVADETAGDASVAYYISNEDNSALHPLFNASDMPGDFLKEIDNFPLVEDWVSRSLAVAEKYNYRGGWSFPINTREEKTVGSLGIYFRGKREATEQDVALADVVTRTAAIIITSHSDSVNRAKAERLLKEANSQLKEMDELKTNFFNNVSHEFRTPLTLLIGPLEEVIRNTRSKVPPEDVKKLQMSHRSAIRLQKLVNTLLDFARIEAGKLEAFYQPTDFSKVTIDFASNFRSAIEKAGLKFVVKSEPINESIYINWEMWEKIVSNLLSNAFKFTQKGKIEVAVRNKKRTVELRVKDTGVGIAARNLNRIFERFVRIEVVQARTFEGTGIGLALVRELVAANGGTIKVKSKENAGSEFIVSIPKGKEHLSKKQIYESKDDLEVDTSNKPFIEEVSGWQPENEKLMRRKMKKYQRDGSMRVLIAEDNADMREYLVGILSKDKYEILAVEDGHKVLTFLRQGGNADLILADVMMPVVDGYELVQWLKSDPKFSHIPIILLSARADEEAKIEGLNVGADDYLVKPFSAKELRAVVMARINAAANR